MERRGSAMDMADDTNYSGKEAYYAGSSNTFIVHSGEFKAVVGDAPLLVKVVEIDAHEGPVYIPEEDALLLWQMTQSGQRCWQQQGRITREPSIGEADNEEIRNTWQQFVSRKFSI